MKLLPSFDGLFHLGEVLGPILPVFSNQCARKKLAPVALRPLLT